MPELVSQLVTDILTEGSFDATTTQALRWLNRRHRQMCAIAECFRKSAVVAGGTVANQAAYSRPTDLVRAYSVTVDGVTYEGAQHDDIAGIANGTLLVSGPGLLFTETVDAAGVEQLTLSPTPSSSGDVIEVYGAYRPPALLIDNSVPLRIDDEAEEGLLAGVYATALSRPSEARFDLATPHEQVFQAAAEALRLRTKRRLRPRGPVQIRLQDYQSWT
jgi:hypothetical protein